MAAPQTSQNAIIAFVLAIVSWAVCPIVCAIIALVMASSARKEIESSGGWKTGEGFVTAAKWIAWVNICVWAVLIVIYALFFFFAIALSGPTSSYSNAALTALGFG